MLNKRINTGTLPATNSKRIWLHAVSVGEVKSIKYFITELSKLPDIDIVLSVTTPAGYKVAKKELSSINIIMAPIDLSFIIKKFIKKIKPDILILNELEIWPNWISITKKNNIPILLINGRLSVTAMAKYMRFKFLLRSFFNKIDLYLVQGEIYKNRFIELGVYPQKIKTCGNIKADEAINSVNGLISKSMILKHLKIEKKNNKIITCASTHFSDEKQIIPVISKFNKIHSFIIVPRHPDRVQDICKSLEYAGIKYEVWSKCNRIDLEEKVLVYDRIGYLFNIQSISDIIIMGGTYDKKIGGHNLFESAILGKYIIGGPDYNNFPDIGETLVGSKIYKVVKNSEEMYDQIVSLLSENINIEQKARQTVIDRKGSIKCIMKEIQKILA